MGRILLQDERVTAPEKRLVNRRQTADRRASQPRAVDQSGSPRAPSGSPIGAICPKCGSARTSPTAQVEDESHQLNLFRCDTCHARFVRATES
jgi:hypothetical protein